MSLSLMSRRLKTLFQVGLYATKKIGRSDERGYHGADPPVRKPTREVNLDEETRGPGGGRKKYYN